ncbi:hypothetical protein M409DRAFT_37887 [Zasmidium cellare ATCC 36951]|uniref:Xylanolytic transcriptional activator regulatory domain-containing protein n=1 Tax=Zasmidium cellare ATCC 36951 TaxID=1080233 RepID=A0A6A6C1K6_ZASCE|nr:uncharacterized protein M409DRAFT_37887 [Zasmidium cellare ATCC 36951]KAF2159702.1 hypothetical protein M409DRAFT_37887 [Zasmidium cellare ATCC 36951]
MDSEQHIRLEDSVAASSPTGDESRVLGYTINKKGTAGIIHSLGESTSLWHDSHSRNDLSLGQYASAIRELPSLRHMDILVQAFFQNVAWHYDIVDEATFTNQLFHWRCLSHKQLKNAPESLPASLRAFPALLFQVLAQALLFQPKQHDKSLDDLKYAADMELSDRAAEYSDTGHRLASSFRKDEISFIIVQAGLMRACFEKTTGAVTEAWHTLGTAIRDAQELGLHRLEPASPPYLRNEGPERDLGSKLWLMLHLWDAHMAIVLGRPMSTRMNPSNVPFPALCDSNRPPRSRDVILCGYHTAHKFLQDIHDLETMDDCRLMVQNIHEALLTNIAKLPAWASPQRSRQHEPHWLSAALEVLFTNIQFVLFALHRPFVFVDSSNRANAVHAATQTLASQQRLFDQTEPLQYRAFSFVFATFDAMVLIAAVHIRFPDEMMDQFSATIANFEAALSRLKVLQASNKLARPAYNVLQRLYGRLLAITTPTESSHSSSGHAEGDSFSGMETEMSYVDWDGFLQPDFENVLCPQPLTHLLCNGDSAIRPSLQTQPVYGLDESQFDFVDNSEAIPTF